MLDLRRLRLLHELALRGTLAAVAEALAYSPSTISQQLSKLEQEVGVPLLRPDGRRVQLTQHGELLAAHAARLLDLEEQIRSQIGRIQPGFTSVRAAVLQSAAHGVIPRALTLLAEREPSLRVELTELPPERGLFELVARGFDMVIAEQYPGHTRAHGTGTVREPLGWDDLRLATPVGLDEASLAALSAHPWVMEPTDTAARQWAVQQCRAAGFEPDVRYETADLTSHVRLIAAGHAVGMLPDLLWAGEPAPVRLHELPGRPRRELFTVVRTASVADPGIRALRRALADSYPVGEQPTSGMPQAD